MMDEGRPPSFRTPLSREGLPDPPMGNERPAIRPLQEGIMQRDELLALMISVSAPAPRLDEWDRVLSIYAGYLEAVASKLSEKELGNFIGAGAMFYRTLCQADAYRQESVWGRRKKEG